MDFLRSGKHRLVRPEVLGLPATTGQTDRVIDRASGQLTEALVGGDEEQARQIVFDMYLAGHSICAICDLVFAKSLREIGDRWECGAVEVYQERYSCEQALRVLYELRMAISAPPTDAPLAIGGAIEGDQYYLATTMVELVLRDAKWNAKSLGNNLPLDTLNAAIKQHSPRVFWISASHMADESNFIESYSNLYDEFGRDVAFVVGGRALTEEVRQQMKYAAFCDNLEHLGAFTQTLLGKAK
jgi:methanogenic corrinoid protein MtbC1